MLHYHIAFSNLADSHISQATSLLQTFSSPPSCRRSCSPHTHPAPRFTDSGGKRIGAELQCSLGEVGTLTCFHLARTACRLREEGRKRGIGIANLSSPHFLVGYMKLSMTDPTVLANVARNPSCLSSEVERRGEGRTGKDQCAPI